MDKGKSSKPMKEPSSPTDRGEKVGQIFPDASLKDYASKTNGLKDSIDRMSDEDDNDEEGGDSDVEEEGEDNTRYRDQIHN